MFFFINIILVILQLSVYLLVDLYILYIVHRLRMKKYLKPAMTKAVSLEWTDGSAINENDTNGRGISAIIAVTSVVLWQRNSRSVCEIKRFIIIPLIKQSTSFH